jgi:metal-responsive CopG/Arc/MetJ family transcriptional regulator
VKIPSELAEQVDAVGNGRGYRSRAEFVNDAIRRFMDFLQIRSKSARQSNIVQEEAQLEAERKKFS